MLGMRTLTLVVLMLAAGPGFAAAPQYRLRYDGTHQSMDVTVCPGTAAAERRFNLDYGADANLSDVKRSGDGDLDADAQGYSAQRWGADECLSYRADLAKVATKRRPDEGWRIGDDLLTAPSQWLVTTRAAEPAEVEVDMAQGYALSVPWQRLPARGATQRYRIAPTPEDWAAYVAVGKFSVERVPLKGGDLYVSVLGMPDVQTRQKLQDWLADISKAALAGYGEMPLKEVQVLIVPVGVRGQAVLFGQSSRGQGNALVLLVDPSRPIAEFRDDWTAVHELAHLFHPYLGDSGRWLGEGLASYWQNVLRARVGLLTPAQAWQRLEQGYVRARADAHAGMSLQQVSDRMHALHAFQRVYWGGSVYWLEVDRELRQGSGGTLSVDLALRRFHECCLPSYREWKPEEFVAKLDALLQTDVFTRHYRAAAAERDFPDLKATYAALGLTPTGTAMALGDAPQRAVRDAIMRAPAAIAAGAAR